jgi:peptide/nickel transport system permease protein
VSAASATPDQSVDEYTFAVEARSHWALARRRFFRHRLATASLVVLIAVFGAGFLAGQLAPHGYQELSIDALSAPPSWAHPFGTDQVGRDYFSRVLHGLGTEARIALLVGFFGTIIGTSVGAVCGYFGGLVDNVLMRATDLLLMLPPLITVLVAATYLHTTTLFRICLLFACLLWMPIARIVRGTSLSLREQEYVDAARAMGASDMRIIARHILPNAIGSVAVAASVMTATAIILETTLSYLGLGISRYYGGRTETTLPSLGDVMAAAQNEGLLNWWGILFPGLAIVFMLVPIYFVGDGIRDALDPTERRYTSKVRARRRRRVLPQAVSRRLAAVPRPQIPTLGLRDALAGVSFPNFGLELPFVEGVRRLVERRRARRRRLLLEALAVLLVTAGAAVAVYVLSVDEVGSPWRTAGTQIQNVSHARGVQTEVTVAVSPSNPRVLFAASNDSLERTIRVYSSTDGGRTWSSKVGPYLGFDDCARGEPAVTIAPDGREYAAFIVNPYCTGESPYPYLVVASRADHDAKWLVRRVGVRRAINLFDAKPAIASAPDGRVHVAWTRALSQTYATTVLSSSADGGRTWSTPRVVSRRLAHPQLVSLTVDSRALYLAGVDARFGIWIARSTDRGGDFSVRRAGPLRGNRAATCAFLQRRFPIPFEANHCNGPNPTVTIADRRVYVTYGAAEANQTEGVRVSVFDRSLRPVWAGRVGPADEGKADQFWPAAAADPSSGLLWVCYYDTTGDPSRKQAWFSCTVSSNGRDWSTPLRTTEASANQHVLVEDARIYGFGDLIGHGGYTGLAVAGGTAYPMWIDTRDLQARLHEIFAARIRASSFTG